MPSSKRLTWIDGIKGYACLMIFFGHFLTAFYPACYLGAAAPSHFDSGLDAYLSQAPISVVFSGSFLVPVFFTLSGLVCGYVMLNAKNENEIAGIILKRLPKLLLPVWVVAICVFLMSEFSLMSNEAHKYTQSWWMEKYYCETLSLFDMLISSLCDIFMVGNDTRISPAFWMMNYILLGSLLSYILGVVSRHINWHGMLLIYSYLVLCFIRMNSFLLSFVLGNMLSYLIIRMSKPKHNNLLGLFMIVFGLFLGGYPQGVNPTNIYRHINFSFYTIPPERMYHALSAFMFVAGVGCLDRSIFQTKLLLFLGRISYSVFLLHLPLMFSFSTFLFSRLYESNGRYNLDAFATLIATTAILLPLSCVFHTCVEKPCYRLVNSIAAKLSADRPKDTTS